MRHFGAFLCVAISLLSPALAAQNAPAGAASKEELAAIYRRYFDAGDVEKLESLVYWPGVAQRERAAFVRSVNHDLQFKLKNIEFSNIGSTEVLEYSQQGETYRPTLSPVARMVAVYEGRGEVKSLSTSYLVGVKNHRVCIVLASRVPK